MIQAPAYNDVVELFDIAELRKPGDLVLDANGNITIHDGDLQLGDRIYNAFFRLVQAWRFHAPALDPLCQFVFSHSDRKAAGWDEMVAFWHDLGLRRHTSPTELPPNNRYEEILDTLGASETGTAAYAGTVMVVFCAMLQQFKRDLGADSAKWRGAKPLIGRHSFGVIVQAAGNNFRHSDEWRRTATPTQQQEPSIRVLLDVLGKPSTDHRPVARNVCPIVLEVLAAGGGFIGFSRSAFTFAKAMI